MNNFLSAQLHKQLSPDFTEVRSRSDFPPGGKEHLSDRGLPLSRDTERPLTWQITKKIWLTFLQDHHKKYDITDAWKSYFSTVKGAINFTVFTLVKYKKCFVNIRGAIALLYNEKYFACSCIYRETWVVGWANSCGESTFEGGWNMWATGNGESLIRVWLINSTKSKRKRKYLAHRKRFNIL